MRLHGWCVQCHRIKRVRVTQWSGGTPIGICADCEEKRRG